MPRPAASTVSRTTSTPWRAKCFASSAPDLERLDRLIEGSLAVNGVLSFDDIRVLPLVRSIAVVKGLGFPRKVRDYFEAMMSRIGYQSLPAV
jgi:glutaredoxin 2